MPDETLRLGAFGDQTRELHATLISQGFDIPASEVQRGFFGPATHGAVVAAQSIKGLTPTGVVDAATAAALNVVPAKPVVTSSGTSFAPTLVIAGSGADQPGRASGGTPIALPGGQVTGGGTVPTGGTVPSNQARVSGLVVTDQGFPAATVQLRVYQRGLFGASSLLGQSATDQSGNYAIPYTVQGPANIEIYAVGGDGTEHQLSKTQYDAPADARLDLVAPGVLQPRPAEFRRLAEAVAPHTNGDPAKLADAVEHGERRDLTAVSVATGWDVAAVWLASEAFSNETHTQIPAEGLYALGRAGLPTDVTLLARAQQRSVAAALKAATVSGIIDATVADRSLQAVATFAADYRFNNPIVGALSSPKDFLRPGLLTEADQRAFTGAVRDGGKVDIWDRAKAAGVTDAGLARLQLQGKLAYLTFNNAPLTDRLMAQVTSDARELIALGYYQADKWGNELSALAGPEPGRLTELIPPAFRGRDTDGGVIAYSTELARRVRQMDPHAVTVERIADAQLDGVSQPDKVGRFLRNAAGKGFRLGRTPLSSFVSSNESTVWTGLDTADRDAVLREVRTLSSLYAVSPDDDSMNALLRAGFSSATQIATLDADSLHVRLTPYFPQPAGGDKRVTTQLLWKARQHSATVFNVFDGLKRLSATPYAPGSSPGDIQKRDDQIVKTRERLSGLFPTLENLFGSVNYCECEHCQSVLSPAAYLVDLLRFIDPAPEAWDTMKASYRTRTGSDYSKRKLFDVLDDRRPDLKNIALTCENTNVALPYIDVANEVLEQVMMSGQTLLQIEAYDVGDASTTDLIAEPANILWSAYVGTSGKTGLRDLVYPPGLPFDLPLEMVRAFLDRLDLPLWRVRELLARPAGLTGSAAGRADGWVDVWYERLGFSAHEVAALADTTAWFRLFGYDSAGEALRMDTSNGVTRPHLTSLGNGRMLSRRLGVSYADVVELLRTRLVNPDIDALLTLHDLGVDPSSLDRYFGHGPALDPQERAELEARVHTMGYQVEDLQRLRTPQIRQSTLVLEAPDAGCDFSQTFLAFSEPPADPDATLSLALLKMTLLVRLHRRLGWSIHEVDRAVLAVMPTARSVTSATWGQTTRTVLIYLAHVTEIRQRLGERVTIEEILTLWSDIPTVGVSSLYERLFLTHAVLGHDPAFAQRLGKVLTDPTVPLSDHLGGVSQALRLSPDDIEAILAAAKAADRCLTITNLSTLMRYAALARGLDIPIQDLLTLLDLSARQPFPILDGSQVTTLPADQPWNETLGFLRDIEMVRDAGVDVGFLDRVCRRGGGQEEPPAGNDPLLIAVAALSRPPEVSPDKWQVLLAQTLAAQLSASETLIRTLLDEVLKDSAGRPLTQGGFADPASTADSLTRLRNALFVVQSLDLTEKEIHYLMGRPGALDLNELPTGTVTRERSCDIRQALVPWLEMGAAHKRYPNRARLLAVFTAARQPVDAANTATARAEQFRAALAALTGFDPVWLEAALDALGVRSPDGSTFELAPFADPGQAHVSIQRLRAFTRLRLDPHDIIAFAGGQITDGVARKIRASLKGRYASSAWRRLVQPAYDRIRQRQRDALVAHLTTVVDGQGQPVYGETMEKLFEYLLLDPGMEPVVLASRIQLAISTVQLFVQRCLMNLEPDVDPQIIDAERWEWMSRYRIWEANRKIFIMAANWLAPEFRDDKTHLFRKLESKLFQGDVNDDLVRECLHTYVKGLEQIARLELLTMYYEPGISADAATVHLVGRTPHAPHQYFYRTVSHGMWTPWQPVDVGVEGEHLVLTSWRGRMHLFWMSFIEQTGPKEGPLPTIKPAADEVNLEGLRGTSRITIQLHWAEQINGDWGNRGSTGHVETGFSGLKATTDEDKRDFFVRAVIVENAPGQEDDGLEIHIVNGGRGHKFAFFSKLAPPVSIQTGGSLKPNPFGGVPRGTKWAGAGPLQVGFVSAVTERTEDSKTEVQTSGGGPHRILQSRRAFTLLFPNNEIRPPGLRRPPSGVGRPSGYISRDQNAEHVTYRSSDGNIHDLFRAGRGWFYQSPSAEAQLPGLQTACPPAVTDPHGYSLDGQRTTCIAYTGSDAVHEFVWSQPDDLPGDLAQPDTLWRLETLYRPDPPADRPLGRPLGGLFRPRRGVTVRTQDRRLRSCVATPQGTWEVTDLNTGMPRALSDPAGAVMERTDGGTPSVASRHLFYVGDDGDVHELRTNADARAWTHTNITADIAGVVKPKAGATPAAYAFQTQGTLHVVYRGTDDRVHELWGLPGSWNYNPIGATFTKAGGDPSGYVTEWANTQHVVYRGDQDQVVELWWNGTWQENVLGHTVTAAAPAKTDVAGYSFEANTTQHVTYFDDTDAPRELCWDGPWHSGSYDLDNPFPDDLGPLSSPFFYEASSADHTFFVEPYVVETAVHEWSQWIVTTEEYVYPVIPIVPINPNPVTVTPSPVAIIQAPGFVRELFPRNTVLITPKGTLVNKILPLTDASQPRKASVVDLRSAGLPARLGVDWHIGMRPR